MKNLYPLKNDMKLKIRYIALYIAAPSVLLCLAILCLGGLAKDLHIGGMGFPASKALFAVGLCLFFGGAGYLFLMAFLYGWFEGYHMAANARAFKKDLLSLLRYFGERLAAFSPNPGQEVKKDLEACENYIKKYRKFYLTSLTDTKLEAVVFNEAMRLRDSADKENFSEKDLAAGLKKVRFCIGERFGKASLKSYKGTENYAMVSYAHRNSKVVLAVIKKLQEEGLNIWFDEGITEGEDWMDHIALKIDGCSHFVMFQTHAYVKSINCNVEIKRAIKTKRKIIRLLLDDSRLAEGVEMYLDSIQGIECYDGVDDKVERLVELLKTT